MALAALALALAATGCGESEGVSSGATVHVYVGAPLCAGAEGELAKQGGEAGDVEVQVTCLADAQHGKRLDLATVGANARRATEDSATIAYVEPAGSASRFSKPILEAAGIASIDASSGATAISRILRAVRDASSSSLRSSVRETLE